MQNIFSEYDLQISPNKDTFANAEASCLPKPNWPHRSQLFFSEFHKDLDYVSSLVQDAHSGEPFWVGIDDRDGNNRWGTSLKQKYLKTSSFFTDSRAGNKPCGVVTPNSGGFISTHDCNLKHYFVCETKQLNHPPDYPCPSDYIPYKDMCLMPNPQRKTFDSAQVYCATRGGIILPVKDKGTFEFIKAWAPQSVRNDVWMGIRKQNVTRTYHKNGIVINGATKYLVEQFSDELMYSDGKDFDINSDYKLEAPILRGECFALKSSDDMELRDYKCNREIGFICQWINIDCPKNGYTKIGQLSSGRQCFGASGSSTFEDSTCNVDNDLLRERWTPKGPNQIDLYRRALR